MKDILIIEDDDIMLKAINNILNKNGYKVVTARNGKEGMEIFDRGNFALVITDMMMPYTNGLEVISHVKSHDSGGEVGLIVVSSIGSEDSILEAFRLGADDYLKKPIMPAELLIRIKKILNDKSNSLI
ncbi:MAG: response regulator [Taibaiella sp.]|nr:response regulator [Taibaiella sp.]